jgi:hypothetical protein
VVGGCASAGAEAAGCDGSAEAIAVVFRVVRKYLAAFPQVALSRPSGRCGICGCLVEMVVLLGGPCLLVAFRSRLRSNFVRS